MDKNIVCIIQARVGSTRLPNKIFLDLEGKPVLAHDIERVKKSKLINKIVIASPDSAENDIIENYVKENYPDTGVYRGSENDVLDRYYQAAVKFSADIIIRITSDCPLIDGKEIDKVIKAIVEKNVDYAANVLGKRTYPRGMDTEVFTFLTLEKIWNKAVEEPEREHVTLYLHKHPNEFSTFNVEDENDNSGLRLTLDEKDDYELIRTVYEKLYSVKPDFDLNDILKLFKEYPDLAKINQNVEQKKYV
jgi:spore coat polysaccharide biosynthesis protein SpsF